MILRPLRLVTDPEYEFSSLMCGTDDAVSPCKPFSVLMDKTGGRLIIAII